MKLSVHRITGPGNEITINIIEVLYKNGHQTELTQDMLQERNISDVRSQVLILLLLLLLFMLLPLRA
jgi:hypothetical protein